MVSSAAWIIPGKTTNSNPHQVSPINPANNSPEINKLVNNPRMVRKANRDGKVSSNQVVKAVSKVR